MIDTLTEALKEVLRMPEEALAYELSLRLAHMYPTKYILETSDPDFDLEHFCASRRCRMRVDLHSHVQLQALWKGREKGAYLVPRNGAYDVVWNRETLRVIQAGTECGAVHFILAETPEVAKSFFAAVCRAITQVEGQILVFSRGQWRRDRDLVLDIGKATLDNLVLPAKVRAALDDDVSGFFGAQESYRSLGVPWKRGVLMLGPPGNGKTHAIKALVNELKKPCLYVRSLVPSKGTIHGAIESVFHRARETAPCFLVLEDLDSLVDAKNRSFFLNEMDGFAANHGILTIATTNHPEKLDIALLERPSRFDRKITFGLPGSFERLRFLEKMLASQISEGRSVSAEELAAISEETDGFSYAYLKELCLSGLMAWMRNQEAGSMGRTLRGQIGPLRAQMIAEPPPTKPEGKDEDD